MEIIMERIRDFLMTDMSLGLAQIVTVGETELAANVVSITLVMRDGRELELSLLDPEV